MIVLIGSANLKQVQFFGGSHKTITYLHTCIQYGGQCQYTVYAVTEQIYSLTSVEPNNNIPKK